MADQPPKSSLFRELKTLVRSLRNLGRVFERKDPLPLAADPLDTVPGETPDPPLALPAPEPHFEDAQLLTQHTPGWHVPHPSHLPAPTYAPAMTAFGIVFIALGAVTVWPLSVVGAMVFMLAMAKWIGELLHD